MKITIIVMGILACATAHAGYVDKALRASTRAEFRQSIANHYIIRVPEGQDPEVVAKQLGLKPDYIYRHAINGFSAEIPAGIVITQGARGVLSLEKDQLVELSSGSQAATSWGIDRLDQRDLPLNRRYDYNFTGKGVTAFILDTGIRYDHQEFEGRAALGYDSYGEKGGDCNGHGTHVAATVGGKTVGVAKEVRLVAVRIMTCGGFGSTSAIVAGMDWVVSHHQGPSVVNMSITGSASPALDDGTRKLIASGVSVVAAAGNASRDACDFSPGRVAGAMTIGATDKTDRRWSGSNFGNCVSWFAPGVSITSAGITSPEQVVQMTGTSMATPHTTGVAALYLEHYAQATPAQVKRGILGLATRGIVYDARGPEKHLLFGLEPNS